MGNPVSVPSCSTLIFPFTNWALIDIEIDLDLDVDVDVGVDVDAGSTEV
jgi:hypothetical protein